MNLVYYIWEKVSYWLYLPWFKKEKLVEIEGNEFMIEPLLRL